jgi:uroporphyrinogen III methyltransferase/synthase
MRESVSLRGKTILVTRTREQSSEMTAEIERLGGQALIFPTIQIAEPESWEKCDAALRGLQSYGAVVFTSANAVTPFFGRCRFLGIEPSEFSRVTFFAVGPKTRSMLERQGVTVQPTPERFSAEELASHIDVAGLPNKRFLFPCGNLSGEGFLQLLADKGAFVHAVMFYRTLEHSPHDVALIDQLLSEHKVDVVTFTSPSAARSFFSLVETESFGEKQGRPAFAVIGQTTASAVTELGFPVDVVAEESTGIGLVRSIEGFFRNKNGK